VEEQGAGRPGEERPAACREGRQSGGRWQPAQPGGEAEATAGDDRKVPRRDSRTAPADARTASGNLSRHVPGETPRTGAGSQVAGPVGQASPPAGTSAGWTTCPTSGTPISRFTRWAPNASSRLHASSTW